LPFKEKGKVALMKTDLVKVLLIEDDEDDYLLVRGLFQEVSPSRFHLDWVDTYEGGLLEICRGRHDVYLLDYHLGAQTGLELLHQVGDAVHEAPIILLTGHGDYRVDVDTMKSGAADYLVKDHINGPLLERSIRYAIERKRSEQNLRRSEKLLKLLSAQLLNAQEEERKRISREIHDSIGSSLSAIKFSLERALTQMEQGAATPESIKVPISITQHAIEESRRIMTDLRPSLLDDLGIISTIGWFCRQFQSIHSSVHIEKNILIEEDEMPESLKIIVFRIVQEALNNIAKYSKAQWVRISLENRGGSLELTIEDNGVGFDPDDPPSSVDGKGGGLGLTGMKERTELSGGDFSVHSSKGAGTIIRARWPLI
jgi:signal transduction histidine kinase